MEEYIREALQSGSVSNKRLEYQENSESPPNSEEPEETQKPEPPMAEEPSNEEVDEDKESEVVPEEPQIKEETEPAPLISSDDVGDLLGLNETNPKALELEQANALALAIVQPGNDPLSANQGLNDFGTGSTGWELALVTIPTNNNNQTVDITWREGSTNSYWRQLQLQNAGYGYDMPMQYPANSQPDPFAFSDNKHRHQMSYTP